MKAARLALAAWVVSAGLAVAAPPAPGGGAPPAGRPPGGSPGVRPPAGPPGGPPGARPPERPQPAQGHHPGVGGGYRYRPSIGIYYGGPYGWGWPGAYWPYASYWPGYYYGPGYYGYGYGPPAFYGPPGVVTSTGGVVYIEREPGTVSTQQTPPASAAAPAAAPPATAPPAEAPPASGTQWWYLCDSPRGAYPYVRECPGGWERVPAIPPGTVR